MDNLLLKGLAVIEFGVRFFERSNFIKQDSERVEVSVEIVGLVKCDLWGHVRQSSDFFNEFVCFIGAVGEGWW